MRKIGKIMLVLMFVIVGNSFSAFGQTELEKIFIIQKFENDGENLMAKIIENDNLIRFYMMPNDEALYLSFEVAGDTSMLYGQLSDFDFEEFLAEKNNVPFEKMTFNWEFHNDWENTDSVWPGELLVYHNANADAFKLKFIDGSGHLIKLEGYIKGTINFSEED